MIKNRAIAPHKPIFFSNLPKERSRFLNPENLIKNSEVIISYQNILQQIKNSHSLLPASRDRLRYLHDRP
ncbi:hypothetical protein QUA00_00560 [Microcoleus sp. T2B6]|uniref:hypothetical protein n=1 Tax=Microcoleus sp. T2B6 TaxID=3055424 RepID=UPI002FD3F86E